jgi:hypothetical protein
MKRFILALVVVALAIAAMPCQAASVEFLQLTNIAGLKETGTTSNTLTAAGAIMYSFLYPTVSTPTGALLALSATTHTPATVFAVGTSDFITQGGYSGTFSLTPSGGGPIVLAGTFTGALFGVEGSSSVTFTTNTVTFTTVPAGMTLLANGAPSFDLSLGGLSALGVSTTDWVKAFTAGGTGTFTADVIPEPFSFLLLGTGLVGLGLLRRRLK